MSIDKKNRAVSKYIRASSNKVGRVLNQIRGKNYQEARLLLEFMPYKFCKIIKKVVDSAVSNTKSDNKSILIIKQAFVNKGPTLKRFQPRAQGRAFPIRKPTCHITIIIGNTSQVS